MKRGFMWIFIGFAVFSSLVLYNYLQAQSAIKDTRPSPLTIDLVSYPEAIKAGHTGTFIWRIEASPDLSTPSTTIYWGYEASPGALTKQDSPQAVGYPSSQPDYLSGNFSLPSSFDLNIKLTQPGQVFFRAYAKIKGDHLWTEEMSLKVEK